MVKSQKDNLELIAANYQNGLKFGRVLIADIFKAYFLGYMFKEEY